MNFRIQFPIFGKATSTASLRRVLPNGYDFAASLFVIGTLVAIAVGARQMDRSITDLQATPIDMSPWRLPGYALLTTLRMFAAMFASLIFTFVVGTLAAKSRKAEQVIVPMLDILQSVPVLGFLTFTVTFFMGLLPGSQLGAELAAVFAIFTSQAWNMAFSFYQSLRTVPRDLEEVCSQLHLSGWQRFWRLDAPFATPGLVWNAMMSMSGGWFFVVASEAISVGNTTLTLPGVGAYLSQAIAQENLKAVAWAILAMGLVILLYDQLVFRPIVAWADKFRMELTASQIKPTSFVYDMFRKTRALNVLPRLIGRLFKRRLPPRAEARADRSAMQVPPRLALAWDRLWPFVVVAVSAWFMWLILDYVYGALNFSDFSEALVDGLLTLIRVIVLIALASLIWVPIGVYIGLRPRLTQICQPIAQFLAAFPANVLFPVAVVLIARYHLNVNIWLSPLMVLGTQWYILFNVIAGASVFPNDLREATELLRVRGLKWWLKVAIPGIFPYYVTGAITASGGSWNAAIVAEVANWGTTKVEAKGLGAYIANATADGNTPKVVLGVVVMSALVVAFNRLFWRRLYGFAETRLRAN